MSLTDESAMSDPEFVLVRGVAYRRIYSVRQHRDAWHRISTPPDATPGQRSKWPPTYLPHRLPKHEVVDEARAREVSEASLSRLRELGIES